MINPYELQNDLFELYSKLSDNYDVHETRKQVLELIDKYSLANTVFKFESTVSLYQLSEKRNEQLKIEL